MEASQACCLDFYRGGAAAVQCRAHAERVRERGGEQKGFSLLPAKKHTEIIVCIVCALPEADSLGLNKKSRDV